MKNNKLNIVIVIMLAIIFGATLDAIHMILPWLFGPILASLFMVKILKRHVKWPIWLGNLGLIILGIQIGSTFTPEVMADIKSQWIPIVMMTVCILIIALLVSVIFKKIANVSFETALLSAIPGALSQMIVMAEENKKADLLVVTLTQTSRILFVVLLVPIISSIFGKGGSQSIDLNKAPTVFNALNILDLILIVICIALLYVLFKRIKFPVPQLLAPIFLLVTWNLITGKVFTLDYGFIIIAQILFGVRVGIQISELLKNLNGKIVVAVAFQNIALILGAFCLVFTFQALIDENINDLFLSAAPGGMAQIIVVAIETGGDIAMISSYHIFRIFFILLVITPLIKFILTRNWSKSNN